MGGNPLPCPGPELPPVAPFARFGRQPAGLPPWRQLPDAHPWGEGFGLAIDNVHPLSLSVQTYKHAAYARLVEMITELELVPGSRLVESDLAARLSVSKTPVREAIAMLHADGLVEVTPYRGATVGWLSALEMEEQIYLVDALEVPAIPLIVKRITKPELTAIGRVVQQLKRSRRSHDGRRFRQLTAEQHRLLIQATGYPRLQRMIASLVGPVGLRYDRVFFDNFEDAWDAALEIMVGRFESIARRDADAAIEIVSKGHSRSLSVNLSRISDPRVRPYFRPDELPETGKGLSDLG